MDLQSEDGGTKLSISTGSTQLLGREATEAEDPTVSRRHLSLHVPSPAPQSGDHPPPHLSLSFQVLGKNPILVVHGGQRSIYRSSEKGELQHGDSFSLSLRNPRFFFVREVERGVREAVSRREKRTLQRREEERRENVISLVGGGDGGGGGVREIELEIGELDVSEVDPVKEFGFLARGHEFDKYPSQRIHSIRDINWFLDEPTIISDEEEDLHEEIDMRKNGKGVEKRKGKDTDDEVWTGESEDEKASAAVVGTAKKRKYSTRSKDQKKQDKDYSTGRKSRQHMADQDIEDEEDVTLGGFIVNEDEEELKKEDEEEELEEEDFEEDDED